MNNSNSPLMLAEAAKQITDPLKRFAPGPQAPLVLELDLTEEVVDENPGDPIGQFLNRRKQHYLEVIEGLRRGARDPHVAALVVRVDARSFPLARAQELRDCIADFRSTGKPAVAWADSFGGVANGNLPYYMATAFSEIVLAPTGMIGLTGLQWQQFFLKGATDKLGVEFDVGRRHEYKSAMDTYTETGLTETNREATETILESVNGQLVQAISQARGLTQQRVRELIDHGPILAEEALEAGLVDRLGYRDQVYADLLGEVQREHGSTPHLQFLTRYHHRHTPAPHPFPNRRSGYIAVISASGSIMLGKSRRSALSGSTVMGSDTVGAAFRAARQDPQVKGVVFRVDSGGGSPVASDLIRRESELTQQAGKPVVTTMGSVAGSGGYYVALGSDAIVAQPGTITGSIGVIIGKSVYGKLLERLGVTTDAVTRGEHAGMFAPERRFTDSEWERINALLDHAYDDFVAKVARARDRTWGEIHEVAKGRVWTGADARERGLVDELGGLETAIRLVRDRVGAGALPVRGFPRPHPLDRMRQHESSEDLAASNPQTCLSPWGALADVAARMGLPEAGPLTMPGYWELR